MEITEGRRLVKWTTRSDVSPLRYPGGKRKLAPFIADLIVKSGKQFELLVEPFAGGAAVALSLLEAGVVPEIALADLDPMVASFWSVVFSADAASLADMALSAELSLAEWKRQKALVSSDRLTTAFQCLYLNRTSFSGSLMAYAGPMGGKVQRGSDIIGSRFNRQRMAARITELGKLRDRVRFVRQASWIDVVSYIRGSAQHSEKVFWYLDPPYFAKAKRLYAHSFKSDDHELVAAHVDRLPGSWLLSYDDHQDSDRLYGGHAGFTKIEMTYNTRVDNGQRDASEIVVSNLIAELRANGNRNVGKLMPLPLRSKHATSSLNLR